MKRKQWLALLASVMISATTVFSPLSGTISSAAAQEEKGTVSTQKDAEEKKEETTGTTTAKEAGTAQKAGESDSERQAAEKAETGVSASAAKTAAEDKKTEQPAAGTSEKAAEEEKTPAADSEDAAVENSSAEGIEDVAGEESSEEEGTQKDGGTTVTSEKIETHDFTEKQVITASADSLADADTLFEQYASRQFGLSTGSGRTVRRAPRRSRFSGQDATVYDKVKAAVAEIADGKRTDTKISIPITDLLTKTSYTKSDLGLEESASDDEAKNAISGKVTVDYESIYSALLNDLPYDLYWMDKTADAQIGLSGSIATQTTSTTDAHGNVLESTSIYSFTDDTAVVFELPVSADYSASGEKNTYTTDSAKTSVASKAADNAKSIVSAASGKSDMAVLTYFKNKICDLVSYNDEANAAAQAKTATYGDPWQLIYVFDGNTNTNVVCEGYSKAFKYLCDLYKTNHGFNDTSLDVYLVTGTMTGGTGAGSHMWNVVQTSSGVYLADITNSDTGTVGQRGDLFMTAVDTRDDTTKSRTSAYTVEIPEYTSTSSRETETGTETKTSVSQAVTMHYEYDDSTLNDYDDAELKVVLKSNTHTVTINETKNGTVTADMTSAPKGATVTLTATPDSGYVVNTITADDTEVSLTKVDDYTYAFTMPDKNVTITPSFEKADVAVTGITVTADKSEITVGDTATVTAKVEPVNASVTKVAWSSSDDKIATVSEDGTVTAVAKGTVTITATATDDSSQKGSCEIKVNPIMRTVTVATADNGEVTADKATAAEEDTVTLTISPDDGYELNTITAKDKDGNDVKVTAVEDGTYTFTMPDADVTVTPSFKDIKVTAITVKADKDEITVGDTVKVTADVKPADAKNKDVDWTSSSTDIATVAADGTVTAKAKGTVTITATAKDSSGKTGSCEIKVNPITYSVKTDSADNGKVTADATTVEEGIKVTLTVTPDDGYVLDTISVKNGDTSVNLEGTGNTRTFNMPAGDVAVTATFKAVIDGTYDVYLINKAKWNTPSGLFCYVYYNNGAIKNDAWPGQNMTKVGTKDGYDVYGYNLPDNLKSLSDVKVMFTTSRGSGDSRYPKAGETGLTWNTTESRIFENSSNDWTTYEDVTYTLKYDANGGESAPEDQKETNKAGSAKFTISSMTPVRTGYTFLGWADSKDSTNAAYTSGGSIEISVPTKTLYAVWQNNTVAVEKVELDKTELILTKGSTAQLKATVTPDNADDKEVTWKSSDPDTVSVSSDGTVTANKAGKATVTATAGGKSATCEITVNAVERNVTVESADHGTVTAGAAKATEGQTVKLTVAPETGYELDTLTAKDKDGNNVKVTAAEDETYSITMPDADVTVTPSFKEIKVTAITVTADKDEITVGDTAKVTADVKPADARNKDVDWTSSSTDIATVSSDGTVTAKAKGTVTITATAKDGSGKTGNCKIKVNPVMYGLTINTADNGKVTTDKTTAEEGETVTLTVTPESGYVLESIGVKDAGGKDVDLKKGEDGTYSFIMPGKAVIVTPSFEEIKVTAITVTADKNEITVGDTAKVTADVKPVDANNKNITWTSSNPDIAAVSADGTVTAKAKGSVTITATAADGSRVTGSCEIKVNPIISSVTVETADSGKITADKSTVEEGETVTLTVTPESGCVLESISAKDADGKDVDLKKADDGTYSFTMPGKAVTVTPSFKEIQVTAITVKADKDEITVGDTAKVTADVKPADAKNKDVSWSSSDEKTATVDKDGTVTARKRGTVTITATATDGSGKTDHCEIKVNPVMRTVTVENADNGKVTADRTTAGEEDTVRLTVTPDDGYELNTLTAKDKDGNNVKVTAAEDGTYTITMPDADVTVTPSFKEIKVTAITVTADKNEITVGDTAKVTADVKPADAKNKDVSWSSSDEKTAIVDKDGTVTARKRGTVTITATAADGSGVKGSCEIKVNPVMRTVTVGNVDNGKVTADRTTAGEEDTVKLTVTPDTGYELNTLTAKDKDGNDVEVTAAADGTYAFTMPDADVTVTSSFKEVKVTKITVTAGNSELVLGDAETTKVTAKVEPANAKDRSVTWTSSENNIATVDESGTVTAKAAGTVTITAAANDGSGVKGSCEITVEEVYTAGADNAEIPIVVDGKTVSAAVDPDSLTVSTDTILNNGEEKKTVSVTYNGTPYTVTIRVRPRTYAARVTYGAGTTSYLVSSGQTLPVITSDIDDSKLKAVYVNGEEISADSYSHKSGESGGTEITLSEEYLNTLDSGNYTVAVLSEDGKSETTVSVTQKTEVKVSGITVTADKTDLTAGDTTTVRAAVTPEDASDRDVVWSSSNTNVATVDANGKVTAVSAGTATITATAKDGSGVTGSCEIRVEAAKAATTDTDSGNINNQSSSNPEKVSSSPAGSVAAANSSSTKSTAAGTSSTKSAKTGDRAQTGVWVTISVIAAAAVVLLVVLKKRNH